jgi:hypothetical protein
LSDGGVSDACVGDGCPSNPFRCIWPASAGDVFGGNSCNGDPGIPGNPSDPCFHTGRYTTDQSDRAPLYAASAAQECAFYGGWLPGLRSFEQIVHAGAPNGDGTGTLWLMEAMYASYFKLALARWTGIGVPGWTWDNQLTSTASLDFAHVPHPFRCVFEDILR